MSGLAFTFREDLAPVLNRASGVISAGDVQTVAGEGAADRLREHFAGLESSRPNKNNWPRQHFWSAVYKSVQNPSRNDNTVTVSVNHIGIAQRFFGGTIKPVSAKALTLPAVPEAYGKRAREFPYLEFGFGLNPHTGKMQPALVEARRTEIKIGKAKKDGSRTIRPKQTIIGGGVLFWLVPSVHQDKDDSVLPTEDQLAGAAVEAGTRFLERKLGEQN